MIMASEITNSTLESICYEMSLAADVPNANVLDVFVKNYPHFSEELTDFAVMLALDALAPKDEEDGDGEIGSNHDVEEMSPSVSRAMSHFQNKLYEAREGGKASDIKTKSVERGGPETHNPIAALSKSEFREFAQCLGANGVLAVKLRDRQIDPLTMPRGFISHAAAALPTTDATLIDHVMAAPASRGGAVQYHKADGKPGFGEQESFADAVKNSGLNQEQQDHLLSL